MDLLSSSFNYLLRFSCIFWTQSQVTCATLPLHTCFDTHIIIHLGQIEGVTLTVAGKLGASGLKSNHAYRVEGEVAAGGFNPTTILFEDHENTIPIDNAEVRFSCMSNKVSAQGVGQIVNWTTRNIPGASHPVTVITVKHRSFNANMIVAFHANYLIHSKITSTLDLDALEIGNVISLRGSVVGHDPESNTWDIETAEIQMIHHSPHIRRSKRRRGLPPSPI